MNPIKNKVLIISACFLIFCLSGCSSYPDLPAEPQEFVSGEFSDPGNKEDTYLSIEYQDLLYIPFGILKNHLDKSDIGDCLGFIVQNDNVMKDVRIYTLKDDDNRDFLLCYDTGTFMEQPSFFRAVDSRNRDIMIPAFIEDLNYAFWH